MRLGGAIGGPSPPRDEVVFGDQSCPSGAGPGNTLPRGSGGEYSPPVPLGHVLPDARGPLEVLVGPFHRLFGLSWEVLLVIGRVLFTSTACSHWLRAFFSDDALWRN